MNKPLNKIIGNAFFARVFMLSVCLLGVSSVTLAQKTFFSDSIWDQDGSSKETSVVMMAPPNLDQCSNGPRSGPVLQCAGANWQNGNLNVNNSQWIEGQSVPYRVTFTGLVAGQSYQQTIEYDTTENGKHAIDYLTSFNRTALDADPCSGIVPCSAAQTFPIPLDPNVSAAGVTQIPGSFAMFNGTITGVSAYTLSGTYAGTSQTQITVTFTANDSTVVMAWGGHIATRVDWGLDASAIGLSGSPYHMRILGTGNQDRSMSVDSVIFPAQVTIIKEVQTFDQGNSSLVPFPFTAVNLGTASFSLVDNNTTSDRQTFSVTNFGAANSITVTEGTVPGWSLDTLVCTSQSGGFPNTDNNSTDPATRTATLIAEEGELISCTFRNLQIVPTAADVSVSGRVVTSSGTSIKGATIAVFNTSTFETTYATTSSMGYYFVDGLPAGDFYIITVSHKRYEFPFSQQSLTLNDAVENFDFISNGN